LLGSSGGCRRQVLAAVPAREPGLVQPQPRSAQALRPALQLAGQRRRAQKFAARRWILMRRAQHRQALHLAALERMHRQLASRMAAMVRLAWQQ